MALEDDIATLASAPLFHLLDCDALRLVAFASETRALRAGDVLFRRGDRSDGGYVVKSGAIALDQHENGAPAFVAGPGALVGQTALFARVMRPATAVAQEPSTVIRVSPNLVRRVLEEFPQAASAMQSAIADELAELTHGLERVRRQILALDGAGEL